MKNILTSAALAATVVLAAGAANATQFVGTFNVNPNSDPGLVILTDPDHGNINGVGGFNLSSVGSSFTVNNLFVMYTNEDSIQGDDKTPDPLSVSFNFTSPVAGGNLGGSVVAIDGAFLNFNYGEVSWNAPVVLNFGNGGQLQIKLSDATFNSDFDTSFFSDPLNPGERNGANIKATFTLLHDSASGGVGGVPEPASWALMIGGFGMSGAMLRRRRGAIATAA